ncbi:SGNH/GDSL hydrolase family protein [Bacillus alkalicellulosilyticus]|uniref:SGNH/GDSL hydrolase family protein n=1 Tax=Alkalihalobacterium alkalicellulosilyticum TaxID=1912214 RepID=UPI0009982255|nr:SGNH/GDSL hydrolase family protein [Bacillus alkalicellulosilyticus]
MYGQQQYKEKISSIASEAKAYEQENARKTDTGEKTNQVQKLTIEVNGLLGKWANAKTAEEAVQMTYFGSESLTYTEESLSWPNLVTDKLNNLLPPGKLNVTIINYGGATSAQVINQTITDDVIESQPDIIIFEPFILNNNGKVLINDTLKHVEQIMNDFQTAIPETDIVIIPSNPLYNPSAFLTQSDALQNYAEENQYLFANHWDAWPEVTDTDLQNYLTSGRPNEQGHQLWADYMADYLIK